MWDIVVDKILSWTSLLWVGWAYFPDYAEAATGGVL